MTPNPVFKVTSLFDAKYLTNDYRYGYTFTIEGEEDRKPHQSFRMTPVSMTFSDL